MANILIIEDNESLCRLYHSILSRLGHEVTLAQTGEAGVTAAVQNRPDLVIMDLILPEMSGAEVAQKLQEAGTFPATPLIITTALGDSHARAVTASLSASALLVKPFEIDTLVTMVHDTLSASGCSPPTP